MISTLGFLSPEIEESRREIRNDHPEVFQISEELSELFIRLLSRSEIDWDSVRNKSMHALAAKSLELFQSAVLLLERGCIPAAKVISRALIETTYKLCAIQRAEVALERYTNQADLTRLQKLKSIQKYREKHRALIALGIEAEIGSLSKVKREGTKPHEWAHLAGMEDFHNLYYQGMSDDVHGNVESLNHYFDEHSEYLVSFGPSDKDLELVATTCQRTLLNGIEHYAQFVKDDVSRKLSAAATRIDSIEQRARRDT